MAIMLTHAITLMAFVLFFALKYRQANKKFKFEVCGLKFVAEARTASARLFNFSFQILHFSFPGGLIFLNNSSILNTWSRVSS